MYKKCSCCGDLLEESSYWTHKMDPPIRWEGHLKKEYLYHKCKQCCIKDIDFNNIETILPLFEEFNVPYIKKDWERIYKKYSNNSIPRYLALMKLCGFFCYEYIDSDWLNQQENIDEAIANILTVQNASTDSMGYSYV